MKILTEVKPIMHLLLDNQFVNNLLELSRSPFPDQESEYVIEVEQEQNQKVQLVQLT